MFQRIIEGVRAFLSGTENLFGLSDIVDILIVAFVIYQVLKITKETRANQVLKGLGIILLAYLVADFLSLVTLRWLLSCIIEAGALALVVLFQPELRRGLEQIGRKAAGLEINHSQEDVDVGALIEEVVRACTNLSRRKIGALIVFENKTGLIDVIETGTRLDSLISAGLLENIFEPNTPLHDGAVVVRGPRLAAAGCFLPLTQDNMLSKELGTRHRAGLGITEGTDATTIIVSEETGVISMAYRGHLTRYLDADSLRDVLADLYETDKKEPRLLDNVFGNVFSFMNSKRKGGN